MNDVPHPDLKEVLDNLEKRFTPTTEDIASEGLLYHYTDSWGLHGIIKDRTIWATDYRFLNDRREMVFGEGVFLSVARGLAENSGVPEEQRMLLRELVGAYDAFKPTQTLAPFVASFSAKEDMLSQWRAYSADGAGYSIGFRSLKTRKSEDAPLALWLTRCRYGSTWLENETRALLRRAAEDYDAAGSKLAGTDGWTPVTAKLLMASFVVACLRNAYTLSAQVKHPAFAEEEEFRLIAAPMPARAHEVVKYRPIANGLVPYIPITFVDEGQLLDIGRVYLGPTNDTAVAISAAAGFLTSFGYQQDLVVPSEVPYRSKR